MIKGLRKPWMRTSHLNFLFRLRPGSLRACQSLSPTDVAQIVRRRLGRLADAGDVRQSADREQRLKAGSTDVALAYVPVQVVFRSQCHPGVVDVQHLYVVQPDVT